MWREVIPYQRCDVSGCEWRSFPVHPPYTSILVYLVCIVSCYLFSPWVNLSIQIWILTVCLICQYAADTKKVWIIPNLCECVSVCVCVFPFHSDICCCFCVKVWTQLKLNLLSCIWKKRSVDNTLPWHQPFNELGHMFQFFSFHDLPRKVHKHGS